MKKAVFILSVILFSWSGLEARAFSNGDLQSFNIDSGYDLSGRTKTNGILISTTPKLYFYIDEKSWLDLDPPSQETIKNKIISLDLEFENNIYPNLTRVFGYEWTPGIDNDSRITVLVHPMREDVGGYFNTADEYSKVQAPISNEREMVYLNTKYINKDQAKSFLAHEFMHLITFNQKDRNFQVPEDIWLNEARSEYAQTLLGYDNVYEGSNLQRRIRNFLDKPTDSIVEWQGKSYDYGALNLFTQYLVDHYGIEILSDSLKIKQTGVLSINAVLSRKGYIEDMSQIFTNWTIAVLVNNCNLGPKYCYLNKNLKNFRITPTTNFLPIVSESTLSVVSDTKQWSGNWQKFIGGQ